MVVEGGKPLSLADVVRGNLRIEKGICGHEIWNEGILKMTWKKMEISSGEARTTDRECTNALDNRNETGRTATTENDGDIAFIVGIAEWQ